MFITFEMQFLLARIFSGLHLCIRAITSYITPSMILNMIDDLLGYIHHDVHFSSVRFSPQGLDFSKSTISNKPSTVTHHYAEKINMNKTNDNVMNGIIFNIIYDWIELIIK